MFSAHFGLWEAALGCYTRAEARFAEVGVRGEQLVARRNRAIVYRSQGRSTAAADLLASLEAEALADGNRAELAAIWHEQAELMALAGGAAEADAGYWRARALFTAIENGLGAADCAIEQGWLALQDGDLARAQEHFAFATPIVTRHPYDRWRNDYGLGHCAVARSDLEAAFQHYRAALETVASLRQRLASEETSSRIFTQAALLHADALRLAAAHGPPELLIEISEWQRALAFKRMLSTGVVLPAAYRAEHDCLRATINELLSNETATSEERACTLDTTLTAYGELLLHARHSSSTAFADQEHRSLDLGWLRAVLGNAHDRDWTALVYIFSDHELLIGMITAEEVALVRAPYDAQLKELIASAIQPAYRRYVFRDLAYLQGQTTRRWEVLHQLGDRLLPLAVRARLHPDHRLLIVPAGPLHGVSWAALRLDDHWLAERAIVQIAPSLMTWCILAERQADTAAALVVGCSAFGARAPALPAVAAELEAVMRHWPGRVDRLFAQGATRVEILGRSAHGKLASYTLLHLATHAHMVPQRGLVAHVMLWDDDLLLPEIAGLRLAGGLTVLSACDGAAADTLPGEELMSLSWAFLVAGAGGVLASLWRVDDHTVAQFMEIFYTELCACRDPALALAGTQRADRPGRSRRSSGRKP
jgi:CHAT domain-containing protein